MKNKLLLLVGLLAIVALPASAQLSAEDASSREYLINHGHSAATADIVELNKGATTGEKVVLPVDRKYDNKPIVYKWIDKFFIYMDPALDNGKFMREGTKFHPSIDDI